jgi:hypothetical protein
MIAKRIIMKTRKTNTFKRPGKELINASTSFLMEGIALMLLKGLRALKVLNDFKLKLVATISRILYPN